jgi:CDP-diacylglycerol--glycerol-3-phosphate 3-phosphatidyltransferase
VTGRRLTISDERRTRVKGAFEPMALAMGRAGLTPDALTLIGFAITVGSAILLANQLWLVGGLVMFLGGVFDMFDGTLARATGRVSPLGAFMDSVFDRWGEAFVYLGLTAGLIASGWADAPLYAVVALVGAFMVSYVRSKAEGLGFSPGTGMAAVGVMPREVRLVVLTMGLVLGGLAGTASPAADADGAGGAALPFGIVIIEIALAIIALGATITVLQRIIHVRRQAAGAATTASILDHVPTRTR